MTNVRNELEKGEIVLSASPETAEETVNNEDNKKIFRNLIIKVGIIIVSVIIIIIIGSIAWFTMSREDEMNGMSMTTTSANFVITVPDGSNGLFYDKYHSQVIDSSSVVWKMTDSQNMKNYSEGDSGIHPGSYGELRFGIKPKVESVTVDFSFELLGYSYGSGINLLNSNEEPALFLNGHVLLFEERTGSYPNFVYSDPILSGADMKRIITDKTFTGKDVSTPVTIYWVWPNTLSTLIDARNKCDRIVVNEKPFTLSGSEITNANYAAVVNNICSFPDYYMKGVARPSGNETLSADEITENYDKYGDYYDQGDNAIGTGISYVVLKLTVSEST